MGAPARTVTSLTAATGTATGSELVLGSEEHYITAYVHSTGTISAGVITIEEAHDSGYAGGTWASVSAITVPTSGNQIGVAHAVGVYSVIRARVSTAITGGGSATAILIAVPAAS